MVDKVRDGIAPVPGCQLSVDKVRDGIATVDRCSMMADKGVPTTQQLNNIATDPAKPDSPLILTALVTFSKVRKKFPNARYTVIGSGLGERDPLHQWAARKGFGEGVDFKGWRPHPEVLSCMKKADILFHPSLEESFGYPVAEALAAGIPVVASRQAKGCAWLLDGGKHGVLADGRSDKEMADALFTTFNRVGPAEDKLVGVGREHIRALCGGPAVLAYYQAVYPSQRDSLC